MDFPVSNILRFSTAVITLLLLFDCPNFGASERIAQVDIVSLGIFTYETTASLSYVGPAFNTGLETLRRDYPQFRWTHKYLFDENITTCIGMAQNAFDLLGRWYYRDRNPNSLSVLITCGCNEVVYLNQLAAEWDLLLITSAVTEFSLLRDRQRSPTWLNTTPTPFSPDVYTSFVAYFNWIKIYVVLDESSSFYYAIQVKLVTDVFVARGLLSTRRHFSSDLKSASQEIEFMLREFNTKSRVFLYFGGPEGLRKILIKASQLNMTSGEHIYVALLPYASKFFGTFTWKSNRNGSDGLDDVVCEAYRSVVLLTLTNRAAYTTEPRLKTLTAEWSHFSENLYNNSKLQYDLQLHMLDATHTALEIMGVGVSEQYDVHQPSILPSGRKMAKSLMNRTFNLRTGHKYMTAFAHLEYHVRASYFDQATRDFKVFLLSSLNVLDDSVWSNVDEGVWFGQPIFPSDEPKCGFDGKGKTCLSYDLRNQQIIGAATATAITVLIIGIAGAYIRQRRKAFRIFMESWWKLPPLMLFVPDVPAHF